MAKASGKSMLVLEELLERGDPAFVDELRAFDDADRLATFAAKWYADRNPSARRLLLEYLDRPLNAGRHEPLVKRLFKRAEAAADDVVMARFLVLFDRSVRRRRRQRYRVTYETLDNYAAAQALIRSWADEGAEYTNLSEGRGRYFASARWSIESVRVPGGTTMPRARLQELPESVRRRLEGRQLFSVHTRNYLRRRTWRYFRMLGTQHPERYVLAVVQALKRYQDSDVADGLALLDNWGLVHILFHKSPVLVAKTSGWILAPGRRLAELVPAPIYEDLWLQTPLALIELVRDSRCRTVRQWALHFLRRDGGRALARLPVEELFALVGHQDAEVATLAVEILRGAPALGALSLERWLTLLDSANASVLDMVCELMVKHLHAGQVSLDQAVQLASRRPLPISRLGLAWLRTKTPVTLADCRSLLSLTEAQAEASRGEIMRWVRQVLSASPHFQPDWVLELLDCRHADVRGEGWLWFQEEPRARENVELWQRLLESPYDDVRLKLVAELERRATGRDHGLREHGPLDATMVRLLWASVLLNIQRGNRAKPLVVGQIVRRLRQRPDDAAVLLPILSVALRSIRGPEWRAGLAGVVQLVEGNPKLEPLVRAAFPELSWTG
jgi:hypothetical protein